MFRREQTVTDRWQRENHLYRQTAKTECVKEIKSETVGESLERQRRKLN